MCFNSFKLVFEEILHGKILGKINISAFCFQKNEFEFVLIFYIVKTSKFGNI